MYDFGAIVLVREYGLKTASCVRFDKIATLSKKTILGELGRINVEFLVKHKKVFFDVFGF